jgi:hypothetical protein
MNSSDIPSEADKPSDKQQAAAGATQENSSAAPGDTADRAAAPVADAAASHRANGGRGRTRNVRWLLRAALAASCLASVLVVAASALFAPGGDTLSGEAYVTVVTLIEGDTYGDAVAIVGPKQEGSELTSDDAIREAVAAALQRGESRDVLIRVSGGVSQREVERVRRLVNEAALDGEPVALSLTLLTRE